MDRTLKSWTLPRAFTVRSVGLVLSLTTGLVLPQYHLAWDDHFQTTRDGSGVGIPEPTWMEATGFEEGKDKERPPKAMSPPTPGEEVADRPPAEPPLPEPPPADQEENEYVPPDLPPHQAANQEPPLHGTEAAPPRRSTRTPKPTQRYQQWLNSLQTEEVAFEAVHASASGRDILDVHPLAFAASSDPDTMYLNQALRAPDREEFISAIEKEVQDHTGRGHWTLSPVSKF